MASQDLVARTWLTMRNGSADSGRLFACLPFCTLIGMTTARRYEPHYSVADYLQ